MFSVHMEHRNPSTQIQLYCTLQTCRWGCDTDAEIRHHVTERNIRRWRRGKEDLVWNLSSLTSTPKKLPINISVSTLHAKYQSHKSTFWNDKPSLLHVTIKIKPNLTSELSNTPICFISTLYEYCPSDFWTIKLLKKKVSYLLLVRQIRQLVHAQ